MATVTTVTPSQQYTPYVPDPQGAGQPGAPVTIINNIYQAEKKEDKKDDKKDKKEPSNLLGYNIYLPVEIGIHYCILNASLGDDLPYRTAHLVGCVAGAIFGLHKAMTKGGEPRLKKKVEEFSALDWSFRGAMLAGAALWGPVAMYAAQEFKQVDHLGNVPAFGWGFSLGSDLSLYAYNSLVSKKINNKEVKV